MRYIIFITLTMTLFLIALTSFAQHELVIMQETGPAENRVSFVVLGDGFTAGEQDTQEEELRRAVENVFANPPLSTYRDYVNFYLIKTTSTVSGAGNGSSIGTYYGCYYGCNNMDRLTCCDTGAVYTAIDQVSPVEANGVLVMLNTQVYGGSGGAIATSTLNAVDVPPHEVGHSFAGLADEYAYKTSYDEDGNVIYPDRENDPAVKQEAHNCDRDISSIHWDHWIEANTSIPTTDWESDLVPVGAFLGCQYTTTGSYRPVNNCLMRSLGSVLGPVCAEVMIKSFYEVVDLIDEKSPSSDSVQGAEGDQMNFSVSGVQNTLGTVKTTWAVDGNDISFEGDSISFPINCFAPGQHEVVATRHDYTEEVRVDPQELLTSKASWIMERTDDGAIVDDCDFINGDDDDDDTGDDDDDDTGDDDDDTGDDDDDDTGDDDDDDTGDDDDDDTGDDDDDDDDNNNDTSNGDDDDDDNDDDDNDDDDNNNDDDDNNDNAENSSSDEGCACHSVGNNVMVPVLKYLF